MYAETFQRERCTIFAIWFVHFPTLAGLFFVNMFFFSWKSMSFCQEGGRTNGYMAPSPATDSVHQSPPPKETPDQPPDIASLHQKEPSRSPGLNSGATISWCFVPLALSHKWYDTNEFGQFIISATLSDGMVELNSARNNLISIVLWETNLVPQEKFTMYNLFLIKNINLLKFD